MAKKVAKKKTRRTSKRKVSGRKVTGRKASGRKASGRRPGRPALSGVSTAALMREVEKRRGQASKLEAERVKLMARLEEIEGELAGFGHSVARAVGGVGKVTRKKAGARRGGKSGPRPRNKTTLEEAMAGVIGSKTMGVQEIADAVLKSGYKTKAANFRVMVNQTLIKSERFKKVSRGKYTTA